MVFMKSADTGIDPKNLRVHVTTLGCSKNQYDSEILMGQLQANELLLTNEPLDADVVIVNTCGFITPAKKESIDEILEAGELKKKNPGLKLLVCGCLSQRYQPDLKKMIPEVDQYFGTEDFTNILTYLGLRPKSPGHLYENRYLAGHPHFAYLKISEGCNHKCAFCAIPQMRGTHRSRPLDSIVSEARMLAAKGVVELILIAQDTTFYGLDLYRKQRIVNLLQELEKIDRIQWIRLHYMYPTTFQDELIELFSQSDKIVPYVDMPIQHISDRMLKIMKRGGTSHRIKNILESLRERIPEVALRTSLIVGHPGETEEDFKILKDFVSEIQFDRLGVFKYSQEENTAAYHLPAPPGEVAQHRYDELMEIQQMISLNKNKEKIGKILNVLIDEVSPGTNTAIARTYADSPEIDNEVVLENSSISIKPGEFHSVEIINAGEYELFAKIWRNNENH